MADGLTGADVARIVNRYIGVSGGYLGSFSYASHAEFYPLYCDLDIDPDEWQGTTRVRFMAILRSLSPHDQAKVVRGVVERFPPDEPGAPDTRSEELKADLLNLAARLEGASVAAPKLSASEVVKRALADAEVLLKTQGAVSTVDRVHTAVHGYLLSVCDAAQVAYPADASMTALFKLLRTHHAKLANLGPRSEEITRVLNACAQILDAMNPVRNRASVAHPNPQLLGEVEARLVINVAHTLLGYFDAKLR